MNQNIKIITYHILGIAFFIGQDILALNAVGTPPTLKGYCLMLLEIVMFYINVLWAAPNAFYKKRQIIFYLRVGAIIVVYTLARSAIIYGHPLKAVFLQFVLSAQNLLLTLWKLNYVLGFSFLLALARFIQKRRFEKQQLQLQIAAADAEKARIENTMVQMQLSPHMLLNGLNYIKAYTEELLPLVGQAIDTMANMLRYTLTDIRTIKKVPLQDELEQVQNRIRFQQQLSGRKLCIRRNYAGTADEVMIPPYLIVTIADNLLKYGVLYNPEQPALIEVNYNNGQLTIITQNDIVHNTAGGAGIGLKSVQQILQYYYPQNHTLTINNAENRYLLTLTIQV